MLRSILIAFFCVSPAAAQDIILLGEIHDNPDHHAHQARETARLRPTALVFEMLDPQQVEAAKDIPLTDSAALGRAFDWNASGWPDFALYAPIFAAAPEAALYGAGLPRDQLRAALESGDRLGLPDWGFPPLPPEIAAKREAEQSDAHCGALPASMLPMLVEAQRLRDARIAQVALAALERHGAPVVVITGNGHARTDWGVPALLRQHRPELRIDSLGQLEIGAPEDIESPFDRTRLSPPPKRDDPCAAFTGDG